MKLYKLGFAGLVAGVAVLSGLFFINHAQSAKAATGIVTGFSSQEVLQPGIIVSKDPAQPRTVKATAANSADSIFGVVVDPSDAPLTLNGTGRQVFVASSGVYRVLVSTANGIIRPGDYISMSSLNGIGAKASTAQSTALGQAESGFDGTSNIIFNSGGQAIGRIYVNIQIQKNPYANSEPVPAFLRRTATALANKPVSAVRIYVSLIIFGVTSIAAITILWSGIRSSLVSLGRNPLSRHSIMSGLYKVILTSLGIFAIGLTGVYLLLKI